MARISPQEQAALEQQAYKKHVTSKIRAEWGDSVPGDADDDEVLAVWSDLNVPKDASTEEINDVLNEVYASDYVPPKLTDQRTLMEKAQDVGSALTPAVAPIAANIGAAISTAIPAMGKIAGKFGKTVPAQLGMAGYYGTKLAGAQLAGTSLEKSAAGLPAPNVADLKKRGYSDGQIRNIIKGYVDTQRSLMADVQQTGKEGTATAVEALANAAVLPMTAGAVESVVGGLAGKAAIGGGAGQVAQAAAGKVAGRAAGGALIGGTFGGAANVVERATEIVEQGGGADDVLGYMSNGLLGSAPTADDAVEGDAAPNPFADFGTGFKETWGFGAVFGGAIGAVEAAALAGKGASAARELRKLEDLKKARTLSVTQFGEDFKPDDLIQRFGADLAEADAAGLDDVTLAASIVSKLHPDMAPTEAGLKATALIAEKIKPWRSWKQQMEGGIGSPRNTIDAAPAPEGFVAETPGALPTEAPLDPALVAPQTTGAPRGMAPEPNAPLSLQGPLAVAEQTGADFVPPANIRNINALEAPIEAPGVVPVTPPITPEPLPVTTSEAPLAPTTVAPPAYPRGIVPENLPPAVQGPLGSDRPIPFIPPTGNIPQVAGIEYGKLPIQNVEHAVAAIKLNPPKGVNIEIAASEDGGHLELKKLAGIEEASSGPALEKIGRVADLRGLPVQARLTPQSGPKGGRIPVEKLTAWYEKQGYKVVEKGEGYAVVRRDPQVLPVMKQDLPEGIREEVNQAVEQDVSPVVENLITPAPDPAPGRYHQAELFADTNIAAAKARLAKRGKGRLSAFVDPADLADVSIIGANYMIKGTIKFSAWSEAMVKEFGTAIRPHLARLYHDTMALYRGRRPVGNDDIRNLSIDYLSQVGLGAGKAHGYEPLNVKLSERIAQAYDRLPSMPTGKAVNDAKNSYAALVAETEAQFALMEKAGVKVEFVDSDPYPNSAAMMADARAGRLRVYKTKPGQEHPFMTPEQNDKFRAVHDFFGHASEGYEFGPRGEDNAWRKHASMFSNVAIPAMTTETRGQNSWVNFRSGVGDLPLRDRPFAEQKYGLLPEWTYDEVIKSRIGRSRAPNLAVGTTRGKRVPIETVAARIERGIRTAKSPAGQRARAVADAVTGVPEHLASKPDSKDWYAKSIEGMEAQTKVEYPEMEDPSNMTLFKLLLAITSPQTNVPQNYARATLLWDGFRTSGKMPLLTRFGKEVNVTSRKSVPKLNQMIEDAEGNVEVIADYLMSKAADGEYNAVKEFGPKVGRFFLNLSGVHNEVTVDVWMMRWFRRVNGLLHETRDGKRVMREEQMTDGEQNTIMDTVKQIAKTLKMDESAVQASLWDREKLLWTDAGLESPTIDFAQAAESIIRERNARAGDVKTAFSRPKQQSLF